MTDNVLIFPTKAPVRNHHVQSHGGAATPIQDYREETLEERLAQEYAAGYSPSIRKEIASGITKFLAWAKDAREYRMAYHGYDTHI